jgi:hypothetical protein
LAHSAETGVAHTTTFLDLFNSENTPIFSELLNSNYRADAVTISEVSSSDSDTVLEANSSDDDLDDD